MKSILDYFRDSGSSNGQAMFSSVEKGSPIIAFTDGSCIAMKHVGFSVVFPENLDMNFSQKLYGSHETNNRAEYHGFIKAVEIGIKIRELTDQNRDIIVYSDSELLVNTINKWMPEWKRRGWIKADKKPVKNIDLVKKIDAIVNDNKGSVFIRHVKAHTGRQDYYSKWNDVADKLAKSAAKPQMHLKKINM